MKPSRLLSPACFLLCFPLVITTTVRCQNISSLALRASNDGPGFSLNGGFTLHRQVEEAQIRFTATDRSGKPVLGLMPSDLQVFDGQIEVPELKSFALSRYQPLEVGVLVDLSESIGPQQQGQALMAADLLSEIFNSRDKAFVIGFSNKPHLLQSETNDINMVRRALLNNPGREGLTSLFDAVVETCRTEFEAADSEGRQRIMLLFSDGADNLSTHGLKDAIDEALRSRIAVYAITSAQHYTQGFKNLQQLSDRTGGRVYIIPEKRQLNTLTVAMSESVRGEYTITFRPTTEAAGFHPVRLELPGHRELILHSSSGYYLGQ